MELTPSRVVILGAKGFIGGAVSNLLQQKKIQTLELSRKEVDLCTDDATTKLSSYLKPTDTLLFISAEAPVKNISMLIDNLKMAKSVADTISNIPLNHLVYISSDAVYTDQSVPLTEDSPAEPSSLHGVMHLAREVVLKNIYQDKLCIVRPTLIYGDDDPHNGYGPNSFLRKAIAKEPIKLFGHGEELRDHIWIKDVAEIVVACILRRYEGVINAVSGKVISFKEIADKITYFTKSKMEMQSLPRTSPMPHNGYREFNAEKLYRDFPEIKIHTLDDWLNSSKLLS